MQKHEDTIAAGKHWKLSLWVALFFSAVMVFIHVLPIEGCHGIRPREVDGLIGILFSTFLHADWEHLGSNIAPLFLLMTGLFYFYPNRFFQVSIAGIVFTNLLVWIFARSGCIVGASGLVYMLAGFMALKTFFDKDRRLGAFILIFIFFYGGIVWGIFPSKPNISWESHLVGTVVGFLLAFYYRKELPWALKPIETDIETDYLPEPADSQWQSTSTLDSSEDIENWLNYREINYFYNEKPKSESD